MIIKNTQGKGIEALKEHIGELVKEKLFIGVTTQTNPRPDGGSNAYIGLIHEFGRGHNPERSWLRSTIRENSSKYAKFIAEDIPNAIKGGMDTNKAYRVLGDIAASDVRQKIAKGPFTPLKQATIDRKGSSKPLINDGIFRGSISYEIR